MMNRMLQVLLFVIPPLVLLSVLVFLERDDCEPAPRTGSAGSDGPHQPRTRRR